MTEKRFTITQDFEEHYRQIRDNGKIIMGCFIEPQAEPIVKLLNELHEENQSSKEFIEQLQEELVLFKNAGADMGIDLNNQITALKKENEQLRHDATILIQSNQEYRKEKKQLKQELKEFKDYVFSDEEILCYSCVNCISKGIYEVECSEKGQVDVHSACFLYWKNEVIE